MSNKIYDERDAFDFDTLIFSIFGWRCPSCYILLLEQLFKSVTLIIEKQITAKLLKQGYCNRKIVSNMF